MNKGEGARIAAKSKSGQVGIYLFKEQEKRKKKFNYKSRSQGYSVRKAVTGENEGETVSRPQTQLSQKNSAAPKKKDTLKKPILKNNNDAGKTKTVKSRNVNFVEKNKQAQTRKAGVSSANTVTLTQEQLTKILETLGGDNTTLKLENGDIKIEDTSKQNNEVTRAIVNIQSDKENEETTDLIEPSLPRENGATEHRVTNDSYVNQQDNQVGGGRTEAVDESGVNIISPRSNLGDIGNSIGTTGFNDKDDAARRRRQWREELDKQIAEKQKEKERMKKVRLSGDCAEQWSPWGNLGDSGGRGQKMVDDKPPQVQTQSINHEKPNNQYSKPEPPSSGMDHSYQQANTPAAMRSSFSFGNYTDESTSIKQKEKKAWLQELEKQRQEAKARQAKEKQQRMESVTPRDDYWATQVPTVTSSMTSQNMITKDDTAMEQKALEHVRSETVQSDPLSGTNVQQSTIITPRGHQRGHWALTDPAEVERQDKARTKHLEHIEAVKAQVEEKQRLKKEAIEKKKREDKEEEEKLAKEREQLQNQFEIEAQKQKQKELDALAKHQALVDSMQRAHEESVRLKQEKRMKHLNRNTSTSLQHKEDEHIVVTPRMGGSHGPVQRTPPLVQATMEGHITQASEVRLSTVLEQGVQTDVSSVPEIVSPRINERDKSAGIEYKEHRKDKQKNSVKIDTNSHKSDDGRTPDIYRENKEMDVKVKKRKNKISERPKWGVKTEPKKKVKASDKDLTVSKQRREERRKKRMEELLADQERNMPPPRTKKEAGKTRNQAESPAFRIIRCPDEEIDEVLKYSRGDQHDQKRHTSQSSRNDHYRQEDRVSKNRPEQSKPPPEHFDDYSETPPLKTGDFVPFLRTDERLDVESIPETPAEYLGNQRWEEDLDPPRKHTQYQQNHKDPLFSSDIRKDGELRQKMILKQLSNLRHGLMMKQREVELGFSTTI